MEPPFVSSPSLSTTSTKSNRSGMFDLDYMVDMLSSEEKDSEHNERQRSYLMKTERFRGSEGSSFRQVRHEAPQRTDTVRSRAEVVLRLPNNHTARCRVHHGDNLVSVIDTVRKAGLIFRADDVRWRNRSIYATRLRSLESIGVTDGDELEVIEEETLRAVTVRVESLELDFEVQVQSRKNCWEEIKNLVTLPPDSHHDVLAQERLYYRRDHQWSFAVADIAQQHMFYYDEDRGESIYDVGKAFVVIEFLTPRQGLRASSQGRPHLMVRDAVLGWTSEGIVALDWTALYDMSYIVCCLGFHSEPSGGHRLFLRTDEDEYVDCVSGSAFQSKEMFQTHKKEKLPLKAVVLLLKQEDRIPQWRNESKGSFWLYRRDGVDLRVLKGRIFSGTPRSFLESTSVWVMPTVETDFDVIFNRKVLRHVRSNVTAVTKG